MWKGRAMDEGSGNILEEPAPLPPEAQSGIVPVPSARTEMGEVRREKQGTRAYPISTHLGKDSLAVLDQAVVSGTSFLTTILVGRWCGAEELGVYALGFSLVVTWTCVQESLIALPFTVHRHRTLEGTQEEYAGAVLIHQAFLSAL